MASTKADLDALKAAVASTSTCTPATVVALRELLLADNTKATSGRQPAHNRPRPRSKTSSTAADVASTQAWTTKDKAALATHVINATVKSLSDLAKPCPSSPKAEASAQNIDTPVQNPKRKLRRSNSTPLSPIHVRTLNRVATSPVVLVKHSLKSTQQTLAARCVATVECARVAFASLRAAKGPLKARQTDFQLEHGITVFIGKLIALGMHEPALKELRLLHKRLDIHASHEPLKADQTASPNISDLLCYHGSVEDAALGVVVSCQLQLIKWVASTKKPAHIDSLTPHLGEDYVNSPINLLQRLSELSVNEAVKAARSLASLSQSLLSMCPSVSSTEDNNATEPRLSLSPVSAFKLQSLAFRTQLRWWRLAKHRGSLDEEVLAPYSRCVRALVRRRGADDAAIYESLSISTGKLLAVVKSHGLQMSSGIKSPLAHLYNVLGSTAQSARQYDDAFEWFEKLQGMAEKDISSVAACSLSARLLAVTLKRSSLGGSAEQLVKDVTEGLGGSLSGTVTELDELFESLSLCRRSIVGLLMANWTTEERGSSIGPTLKESLKSFILRYPRFVRRWLGTPPLKDAPAKHSLQFEHRRQNLSASICPILDATLVVAKAVMEQSTARSWTSADEVLQDSLALIDILRDPTLRTDQLAPYTVKISNVYFAQYLQVRKQKSNTKEASRILLQSLNRSIDVVKERSPVDKEKAQLSVKLELLADLCKRGGRSEDAITNLRSICTNMIEGGILSHVTSLLASQPLSLAWSIDEKTATLSRTLRSIARLDKSWNDWTFFMPELERAAVVEYLLHAPRNGTGVSEPLLLHNPAVAALLRLYSLDKYPIRRLRTLLFLYAQNLDNDDESGKLVTHIDQVLQKMMASDFAEDSGLSRYADHFQAYYSTLSSMGNVASFPRPDVRSALDNWISQVRRCSSKDMLYNVLDDPELLLEHLRSLSDLAYLRGESQMQVAISDLRIKILKLLEAPKSEKLITQQSLLATQYVSIGLYEHAALTLEDTGNQISEQTAVSPQVQSQFHVAQAEYFAGVGKNDEAGSHLTMADKLYNDSAGTASSGAPQHVRLPVSYYVQSLVALQLGDITQALTAIKIGIRLLTHDWTKLEESTQADNERDESSLLGKGPNASGDDSATAVYAGPRFWALAPIFLRCLLQISTVYAHIGMFQETVYYAEYAGKIAEGTKSSLYQAQVATWTGTIYARACKLDKVATMLLQAKQYLPVEVCASRVKLARELAGFYRDLGREEDSAEYFRIAVDAAQRLHDMQALLDSPLDKKQQTTSEATNKIIETLRTTRSSKAAPKRPAQVVTKARTTRRTASARSVEPVPTGKSHDSSDVYRSSLVASVALARAMTFIQGKDWQSALGVLGAVQDMPKLLSTMSQEQIMTATSLIGQSMELMVEDPVFSVIQDSTISFPSATSASPKAAMDRVSPEPSPPVKGRSAITKKSPVPLFAHALIKAQELLVEAHSSSLTSSDSAAVHRISSLLQSTVIMLSATSVTRTISGSSPAFATVASELARNIVWKREQMTLRASSTPLPYKKATAPRRSSLGAVSDMARLQTNYIELLPKTWSVISMSLSDNHHDLYITKFQSGHAPFVLRLPLERGNSRDADLDIFTFAHGQAELLDIIKHANETCHSAKDFTVKAERTAWWDEREVLDTRLKELLNTVESTWLGGFKGVFSQHQRRPDLLARFQKSFQKILDGCLPSRNNRAGRGKKTAAKPPGITLDSRILDLFIGLGDPSEPSCDFDEALNDLLYFVVDILQFHGERNAYDEIDFDAMVVETYDALRGYYSAMKSGHGREEGAHTILVLDKALHAFPWESLPCMDGLAVSRVPSLSCLRRLLGEAAKPDDEELPAGHYVSSSSGTYVLNPSSDLKNTQRFFQEQFASGLESWASHINKVPEEADLEAALSASDIYLYFGHGSGAQYVRASRIRNLDKCKPATFLMGCSSAALSRAGEFECYGPVWNHMMAGCPAVVGTLWDVTDRDIDRFAGRAFEEWGLFKRGSFVEKGKNGVASRRGEQGTMSVGVSLPEAVSKARQACRFRYLNAAAVVQYGIPVYILPKEA